MDELSLDIGGANNTDNRVVCQSCNPANTSQTATLTMGLKHLLNLLWTHSSPVIKRIEILRESLLALGAIIALVSIGHLALFVRLSMTTESTFHELLWVGGVTLLYQAHNLLMHNLEFSNYNAATNWSIIRNIAINFARKGGYNSLTKAERFLAHDIDKLFLLLE
jgi:hypothetical protein